MIEWMGVRSACDGKSCRSTVDLRAAVGYTRRNELRHNVIHKGPNSEIIFTEQRRFTSSDQLLLPVRSMLEAPAQQRGSRCRTAISTVQPVENTRVAERVGARVSAGLRPPI